MLTRDNLKAGHRVAWDMADGCVMTGTVRHVGYSSSTVERPDGGMATVKHCMMSDATADDVEDSIAFFTTPHILYLWSEPPESEPVLRQVGTVDDLVVWLQKNQSFSWSKAFEHSWWSLRDHENTSRVLSGRYRHLYRQDGSRL